jgi:DNA-binding MarR family transcriptional regulator
VGKLIYLEQHGQATASELADAFMVTRTLISRNTWRLIQDNLIQSAKINKLKNSTQPK